MIGSLWQWSDFFTYLHSSDFLLGAWTTIWLTFATMILGTLLGIAAAVANDTRWPPLVVVYRVYVTLIRGTPVLMQLVFAYTVLPLLGVRLSVFEAAVLALGVNEGAYVAEILRSGIESIPTGQRDAARVCGFGYGRMMAFVILPQALRIVTPALGNQVNAMFKNTALASVISVTELFLVTEETTEQSFRFLEAYAAAAIMYLLMTAAWSLIQMWIERATFVPGTRPRPKPIPRPPVVAYLRRVIPIG